MKLSLACGLPALTFQHGQMILHDMKTKNNTSVCTKYHPNVTYYRQRTSYLFGVENFTCTACGHRTQDTFRLFWPVFLLSYCTTLSLAIRPVRQMVQALRVARLQNLTGFSFLPPRKGHGEKWKPSNVRKIKVILARISPTYFTCWPGSQYRM